MLRCATMTVSNLWSTIMTTKTVVLQDAVRVPATMAECLDAEDPLASLELLGRHSATQAEALAAALHADLADFGLTLPELLSPVDIRSHPIADAQACADSILHSLTKIASGGSQASQEIRQLEQEKSDIDQHANDLQTAIDLREASSSAIASLQSESWSTAGDAVRLYLDWRQQPVEKTARSRAYAGEYAVDQLEQALEQLSSRVLHLYQTAVERGDLRALGQLTPILTKVDRESEGVRLYLRFLKTILDQQLQAAADSAAPNKGPAPPPYAAMAKMYNCAVGALRHHLPMVAHCLHRAHGDAAVVGLVHTSVQEFVIPAISDYQADKQLSATAVHAARIAAHLEERYTGRSLMEDEEDEGEDCGFSMQIGSLADVDAAMEETACVIQHAESYLRFLAHTCHEVSKARRLRFEQELKAKRLEHQRQEWATGKHVEEEETQYEEKPILEPQTQLHMTVAELGGQYAGIERCLLLASMQRAFVASDMDPRYYRPLSVSSGGVANQAQHTAVVDTCLYAARRSTQRAFATGHTGTASAMTNFCAECLSVLLEVLGHRAEESGVALLKPGEGLLVGSAGIFNAQNLIRQGTHVSSAVTTMGGGGGGGDDLARRQQVREGIARACAVINDLEVAAHHTTLLEQVLTSTIDKGWPPGHDTEQLYMCVKALKATVDTFKVASGSAIESLAGVLRPRIRSIVGEAVGAEGASSGAGFMTSSVMAGGRTGDRGVMMSRMNYNLDDETYSMMQLSEGYVARLCSLLNELLDPLRNYLSPRLWDTLLLDVLGTVSKRLETSLRKCEYTALGAIALDSDMRDLLAYGKERLFSEEYTSNVAVAKACPPLARLLQIAKLLNVDDLDDVLDLISSSKRKNNWDLRLEDTKAYLSSRVEFDAEHVNELLRLPDDE